MPRKPRKVTAKMANEIASILKAGGSVRDVCREMSISTTTFYYWRKRGLQGDPRYKSLVSAIHSVAEHDRIKGSVSRIRRLRYNDNITDDELARELYKEIMRISTQARIPLHVQEQAVELTTRDIEDRKDREWEKEFK